MHVQFSFQRRYHKLKMLTLYKRQTKRKLGPIQVISLVVSICNRKEPIDDIADVLCYCYYSRISLGLYYVYSHSIFSLIYAFFMYFKAKHSYTKKHLNHVTVYKSLILLLRSYNDVCLKLCKYSKYYLSRGSYGRIVNDSPKC